MKDKHRVYTAETDKGTIYFRQRQKIYAGRHTNRQNILVTRLTLTDSIY